MMKKLIILILVSFSFITIVSSQKIHPQAQVGGAQKNIVDDIILTDIHILPNVVTVNHNFSLHVSIINNSPNTIIFSSGCYSPLSVEFDKNVKVLHAGNFSCGAIHMHRVYPGKSLVFESPSDTIYSASHIGETIATVTFHFSMQQLDGKYVSNLSISKLFTFNITDSSQ
jgi:hypothetical protein